MANHTVNFSIPKRKLGKADIEFVVDQGWREIRNSHDIERWIGLAAEEWQESENDFLDQAKWEASRIIQFGQVEV